MDFVWRAIRRGGERYNQRPKILSAESNGNQILSLVLGVAHEKLALLCQTYRKCGTWRREPLIEPLDIDERMIAGASLSIENTNRETLAVVLNCARRLIGVSSFVDGAGDAPRDLLGIQSLQQSTSEIGKEAQLAIAADEL